MKPTPPTSKVIKESMPEVAFHVFMVFVCIGIVVALTGCGTMNGFTMENRVACTPSGDKAFLVSEYGGWIGISSKLSDKDKPYLCPVAK